MGSDVLVYGLSELGFLLGDKPFRDICFQLVLGEGLELVTECLLPLLLDVSIDASPFAIRCVEQLAQLACARQSSRKRRLRIGSWLVYFQL